MRPRAGLAAALLTSAALAGCDAGAPAAAPTTTPDAPVLTRPATRPTTAAPATSRGAQRRYALPKNLCDAADQQPLTDVFPVENEPLAETAKLCATSRSASDGTTVSLSVDADLVRDAAQATDLYDQIRRTEPAPPSDIAGAGAAAFWSTGDRSVTLYARDANLVLQIRVGALGRDQRLPTDLPQRLAAVAAGTFERLAP